MNWVEIHKKYPKAYSEFVHSVSYDTIETAHDSSNFYYNAGDRESVINDRELFDFFDDQGIQITITPDYHGSMEYNPLSHSGDKEDIFYWLNVNFTYEDNVEYKTRVECETAAFEKAFEILENKLK